MRSLLAELFPQPGQSDVKFLLLVVLNVIFAVEVAQAVLEVVHVLGYGAA